MSDGKDDPPLRRDPIAVKRTNVVLIDDPVMPRESPTRRRVFCELEWVCSTIERYRTHTGDQWTVTVPELIGDLREAAALELAGGARATER